MGHSLRKTHLGAPSVVVLLEYPHPCGQRKQVSEASIFRSWSNHVHHGLSPSVAPDPGGYPPLPSPSPVASFGVCFPPWLFHNLRRFGGVMYPPMYCKNRNDVAQRLCGPNWPLLTRSESGRCANACQRLVSRTGMWTAITQTPTGPRSPSVPWLITGDSCYILISCALA